MGISDPIVFPVHVRFIRQAMELHPARRIHWVGCPGPYPVSDAFPGVEHSFLDIRNGFDMNARPWALNESGPLEAQPTDGLTLLRCSYFADDPEALLGELHAFLRKGAWAVLEITERPMAFVGEVRPISGQTVERAFRVARTEEHLNLRGERFTLSLLVGRDDVDR